MELKNLPISKTVFFFNMTYHFLLDVAAAVSVITKYQILALVSRMLTCYMPKLSSGYDEKCLIFFWQIETYLILLKVFHFACYFVRQCSSIFVYKRDNNVFVYLAKRRRKYVFCWTYVEVMN